MSDLSVTIIAWITLGILAVIAIELAERSHGRNGPLSQETILSSLLLSAALVIGAPFLLLYSMAVGLRTVWRGSVPITGKLWWPARAKTFEMADLEASAPPEPRISELPSLLQEELVEVSELYFALRSDGLSENEIFRRIESARRSPREDLVLRSDLTLSDYLESRLPGRYVFTPATLALVVARGSSMASHLAQWPPTDWLQARAEPNVLSTLRDDRTVSRLRLRMTRGDELWTFSSTQESWRHLAGRGGIALVRDGRVIDHIVTAIS